MGREEQVGGVDCNWLLYAQWRARERLPSHAHARGSGKRCTQGRHIHTRIRTRTRTHTRMHAHTHARTHLRPHALAHARADTRTYFHLARESHGSLSWLLNWLWLDVVGDSRAASHDDCDLP